MRHTKKFRKILCARELRKAQTEAEQVLWQYLRNRKFCNKRFRRQYVFCGFIIDFYCPEDKLGIELDGSIHLKQKEYDRYRQDVIEDFGIKIVRFKNREVFANTEIVLQTIKKNLSLPIPDGEREKGPL